MPHQKVMFGISTTGLSTSPRVTLHSLSPLRGENGFESNPWMPKAWGRKDPKGSRDHDASGMVSLVETKGCKEGTTLKVRPARGRALLTYGFSGEGLLVSLPPAGGRETSLPQLSLVLGATDQVRPGRSLDRSNKNNIISPWFSHLASPKGRQSGTTNLELKVQPCRRSMDKVSGAIGLLNSKSPTEGLDQVQQNLTLGSPKTEVLPLLQQVSSTEEILKDSRGYSVVLSC